MIAATDIIPQQDQQPKIIEILDDDSLFDDKPFNNEMTTLIKPYFYDDGVARLGYDLIKEFENVFPLNKPTALPPLRGINHKIDIIDDAAYKALQPRRVKPTEAFLSQLRDKIDAEEKTRRVYTAQDSSASSIFMIKKYDKPNEVRFLHHLRARNDITVKDKIPIPDITCIINAVASHEFRSWMDLTAGYYNVRIEEDSSKYSSFNTLFGTYRTQVMQQRDCNASTMLIKLMNFIFADMLGRSVYVYLNDILIFNKTKDNHIATIKEVCNRLRNEKLYVNRVKTMIFPEELHILGHIITSDGLSAAPDKVLKVSSWQTPNTRKMLQGFMGMVNYLSRYAPHLTTAAAPLTHLCGDTTKWEWLPIHDTSLQQVKDIIGGEAILKPLDYQSQDTIYLWTDALLMGIGALIGQGLSMDDIHPAAFYSRKFKPAEFNYSTTDKETFAVIEGLEHFTPQLSGTRFTIPTYHKAPLSFPVMTKLDEKHTRWLLKLSTFDYDI